MEKLNGTCIKESNIGVMPTTPPADKLRHRCTVTALFGSVIRSLLWYNTGERIQKQVVNLLGKDLQKEQKLQLMAAWQNLAQNMATTALYFIFEPMPRRIEETCCDQDDCLGLWGDRHNYAPLLE
ncbi:unnamed protein product [Haemonchus placei]|uniref:GLOBIN domain-containing protein n=1 Tax=Haemonchus placei TaxID=6290 RepID=A0A0N4W2W4_HAEPC|nr:unnamed protein product [Haemonchus placei]